MCPTTAARRSMDQVTIQSRIWPSRCRFTAVALEHGWPWVNPGWLRFRRCPENSLRCLNASSYAVFVKPQTGPAASPRQFAWVSPSPRVLYGPTVVRLNLLFTNSVPFPVVVYPRRPPTSAINLSIAAAMSATLYILYAHPPPYASRRPSTA